MHQAFDVLIEQGWSLVEPEDADVDELMAWFPDAAAVDRWGGPRFRYPFTRLSFREDCRIDEISSFCLKDPDNAMAAFGQFYNRYDRAHLARLISDPHRRRQGIGRRLIRLIMQAAQLQTGHKQSSLFVYRDNEPALSCYLAMGFVVQDYPDGAPLKDRCYFLTRDHDFVAP